MLDTFSSSDRTFLVEELLLWFRKTKRNLPWRKTYDPYHVWISEIMLQQTQMERGIRYFLRWVKKFPTVNDVAKATEDEILSYWEGLGYYARARNLHKAAQEITDIFDGKVPADYKSLLTLPGIGPYTAAAVASIAGNQDVVVVDANVNRIFARIFNIDEPVKNKNSQIKIHQLASELLPEGKARIFNQALMDFGGLVCTPKAPQCEECIVRHLCVSYRLGIVSVRPVLKPPKKTVMISRVAAVIVNQGRIFMQKRNSSKVWGGLWEFPGGELPADSVDTVGLDLISEVQKDVGLKIEEDCFLVEVSHQYTHHKVTLRSFVCRLENGIGQEPLLTSASTFSWVTPKEMDALPCPSGVRKIIDFLKRERPEMFEENYVS